MCSRWPRSRRPAAWRQRPNTAPTRAGNGAAWSGAGSARRAAPPRFARPRGRRRTRGAGASPRCCCPATGPRCSKARSIRRTVPACIRRTWFRRPSAAPWPPARLGCGLPPTKRPGCRSSAQAMAFAIPRCAALRGPIRDAARFHYVPSTVFVAPATVLIPPNNLYYVANVTVPVADTNTAFYFIAGGHPAQPPETHTWRRYLHQSVGVDLDDRYRPLRNEDNRFWQDRQAMKAGNFTGISGFPNQDVAMWLTMGPIADRSRERLGASDLAIVEFRRQMIDAARALDNGEPAIGTAERAIPSGVCAFQAIIPKTMDWRSHEARFTWSDDGREPVGIEPPPAMTHGSLTA